VFWNEGVVNVVAEQQGERALRHLFSNCQSKFRLEEDLKKSLNKNSQIVYIVLLLRLIGDFFIFSRGLIHIWGYTVYTGGVYTAHLI